ncbi:Ig-like domain-containing protein [Taibaiella soli]|uniref:Secretion system C-terminal sorting domain-containing protein n=1 Tax=Taibaiella soli TaxID=1649169 RepID=A0A2W2AB77_9BACT|nr:T9SS type A sorting domain-containing protein [Taibaiella soli]PZF72665.1 hypothetical protein DN068_12430 [Taibaiella soli]
MTKKTILSLLSLLLCVVMANAQQYTVTGGASTNTVPFSSTTNRVQWLYLPTDFSTTPAPGFINKIYFKTATAITSTTLSNFTIKLGVNNLTATALNTWMGPMTTVYSASSYTITSIAVNGWIGVTLQTPFFYDGTSSLIFEASNTAYTTGFSNTQNITNGNRRVWGTAAGVTPVNAGSGLVDFGFDRTPPPNNNATAIAITDPNNFCIGTYTAKVKIANRGANQIQPVTISWTIDGVAQTPVSYTGLLDTFGSVAGNTAIVSLGSVTFTGIATHTIKAWTTMPNNTADSYNGDDTVSRTMGAALNGSYTIGGATADYPTITDAVNALNNFGVCGPVIMNINSGTYTEQVTLNAISGANAVNTITFTSTTGNAADVTIGNTSTSAANYIFKLSSASYITLRNLSFAPASSTYAFCVSMDGAASRNTISKCVFNIPAAATAATTAGIYASVTGSKNRLVGNTVTNGYYGIYYRGAAATTVSDSCVIDSNTVTNAYNCGIYPYYATNLKLRNNIITRTTSGGTFYGLYPGYCDDALEVTGNTITISGAATGYGIYHYFCNGNSATSLIANNKITMTGITNCYGLSPFTSSFSTVKNNIVWVEGSNIAYGLRSYNTNNIDFLNNTFCSNSTAPTNYAGYMYNTTTAFSSINAYNNIFYNAGTTGYPLAVYSVLAGMKIDYNNVYGGGAGLFSLVSPAVSYATLDAWRAATGYDKYSISYRPAFTSTTNLAPNPADSASWSLNGHGVQFQGNNTDINGNPRAVLTTTGVPDIGPYEFTPTVAPPIAVATPATPAAGTTQVFTFGQDTVAKITWAAGTVPASLNVFQYAGTLPPAMPAGTFMYFYDSLQVSGTATGYKSEIYYKPSWIGNVTVDSQLHLSERLNAQPWYTYFMTGGADVVRKIVNAPALTGFGLQTARMDICSGQPVAATVNTPAFTAPRCVGDTVWLNASDPNNTGGISYQWQTATSPSGPWTNIGGATALNYITAALTDTMYYRIVDSCQFSHLFTASSAFMVPVFNPVMSSVTGAVRCGPGAAVLQVQPQPGVVIKWYDNPTALVPLYIGASYTTPFLYSNATYYVAAASSITGVQAVGSLAPVNIGTGNNGFSDVGLMFTAYAPFVLQSAEVYPQGTAGSGTITVALKNSAGTILQTATASVTVAPAPGVANIVPLNFHVPAGTNYRLVVTGATGMTNLNRDATIGFTYPYTLPNLVSITSGYSGGVTPSNYYYFYKWRVNDGSCQLQPVTVPVTITPAPAVNFVPDTPSICLGQSVSLSAASTNTGYSYYWNPVGLSGDTVVLTPNVTTQYYLSALDSSGGANNGCAFYDTVTVHVDQVPFAIVAASNPLGFCSGDSVTLSAFTDTAYAYQWFENGSAITGATDSTLTVNTAGSYTLKVAEGVCSATSTPQQVSIFPLPQPVIVANPQGILQTTLSYADYQWLKGTQTIIGATNSSYTPAAAGQYYVVVTDANGCTSMSAVYDVYPDAVPEVSLNSNVKVYPNPVADMIYIESQESVKVVLHTIDGREIFSGHDVRRIDVSRYAAGLYILQVYTNKGTLIRQTKIIKQ